MGKIKIYMISYVYDGRPGFYTFYTLKYPDGIMHTTSAEIAVDTMQRAILDNPDTEYTLKIYEELDNV